ncbi:hypothetical protein [Pseudolysinimonas sp.]|jgi:hypothetical protein|uniref:hypothetical protein n=1 Tax=Pseudolysinimonas sp. TaxID=2680009 RepID=UPI00378427D7
MSNFGDPAVRVALERQLALLVPVVEHLSAAAAGPPQLVADDWRGPAAEQATRFLEDLRAGLSEAAAAVDDEVRRIRVHVAGMP